MNDMFEYIDYIEPIVLPEQLKKSDNFDPQFLHELVNDLHENEDISVRAFMIKEIVKDNNNKGAFWESVLAKHMPHTTRLMHNTWYKDFSDGTDAKFASAVRYESGAYQASIGIENKTGTLRVCMMAQGTDSRRLFFMLIPYEFYSTRNPTSPLKITFENFKPIGEIWEKYRCTWDKVISPVNQKIEMVYTDEYQLLLDLHEVYTK